MSVELFKQAHDFFSQHQLIYEGKVPVEGKGPVEAAGRVGKLWFTNPKKDAKGRIDIKVLTQQERALLHFSITGQIPKGFSERQLQGALNDLRRKSVTTEGEIVYERGTLASMGKKMHHGVKRAVKGTVIKTDHLYEAIKLKEEGIHSPDDRDQIFQRIVSTMKSKDAT